MDRDYPRMLYRKGGDASPEIHGHRVDTLIVDSPEDEHAASRRGWVRTPAETDTAPEPEQALRAEIAELQQSIARFDGDRDGRPGGSLPRKKRRKR